MKLDRGIEFVLENNSLIISHDNNVCTFYILNETRAEKIGSEEFQIMIYTILNKMFFVEDREYFEYKGKRVFKLLDFRDTGCMILGTGKTNIVDELIFIRNNEEVLYIDMTSRYGYRWMYQLLTFFSNPRKKDECDSVLQIEKGNRKLKLINKHDITEIYMMQDDIEVKIANSSIDKLLYDIYVSCLLTEISNEEYYYESTLGRGYTIAIANTPLQYMILINTGDNTYNLASVKRYTGDDIFIIELTYEEVYTYVRDLIRLISDISTNRCYKG